MSTRTEHRVAYRTTTGEVVTHRQTTEHEGTACALANLLAANRHTAEAWVETRHVTTSSTEWKRTCDAPTVPHRAEVHEHRYGSQRLTHSHPHDGPHGYFGHDEDLPPREPSPETGTYRKVA